MNMKKILLLIIASAMMLVSCTTEEESVMNQLVGTYSLIGSQYVTWGRDAGTLNVNSKLFIYSTGENTFHVSGYYQTDGRIVGNMLYFDSYRTSDSTGYMDIAISPTTLIGNQMNISDTSSGQLKSNGVPYPFTGRVQAVATKIE